MSGLHYRICQGCGTRFPTSTYTIFCSRGCTPKLKRCRCGDEGWPQRDDDLDVRTCGKCGKTREPVAA